ncbi:MAG: hypothetical protein GWN12_19035 [Thermoplasmata archaeon]|nr:hypothetical protein [Thermoplasmata archaeon]NIS14116.1 hypothetical protein [Thermoplasmata archaeon]NIW90814.1 hypothetical protein [Thermoplasmata archaeon]
MVTPLRDVIVEDVIPPEVIGLTWGTAVRGDDVHLFLETTDNWGEVFASIRY